MKYFQGDDFTISLRSLFQKGGKFQLAAKKVQAAWGLAKLDGTPEQDVFQGMALTKHGEGRIPHCVKYDLTGFARLITVVNNGICLFLFAGDHTAVEDWLTKNRGLDFVARRQGGEVVLDKVRSSAAMEQKAGRIAGESDLSTGALIDLLPARYAERILKDLPNDIVLEVCRVESIHDDDHILNVCALCQPERRQMVLMDVLLSLRSGAVTNAKALIDLYLGDAAEVASLPQIDLEAVKSGGSAVLLSDVDPQLFQHFVETASFEKWMLYLHPSQRQFVEQNFVGPARMAGVSGSGKTCVVVHRALRLAELYAPEKVLVITLSGPLASLIDKLIDAQRGANRPPNLVVKSIFDLCFDKLMEFEPTRRDWYTRQAIAKNPHAYSDHVDEVWQEYFLCENNYKAADAMFEVVQTLNARGVYASDYLRQEFDYIRSSFTPADRNGYLNMERTGRIVPLEERYRQMIAQGLKGWENKMEAVGVIDDLGIVAALHRHLHKIRPEYRAALVDEAQDLGTLELAIVRHLVQTGENDLFLCGDAAQTIYTKSSDLKLAGIDVTGRAVKLNQNYRNSRQILTAAHTVLTQALASMPKGAVDLEVLDPEFASFSSPKPLLLSAASLLEEIERAMQFLTDTSEAGAENQRMCLAVCGFGQPAIATLGRQLGLPILGKDTDVSSGRCFIADLEQTKGFEFDTVVVMNCSDGVVPHPDLPPEESFRDLCRLYVAMTRAKTQLLISYTGQASPFLVAAREAFVEAAFAEYADRQEVDITEMPAQALPALGDPDTWARDGRGFLRSRDAVGLDRPAQDKIIERATGKERNLRSGGRMKQEEWRTFGSFCKAMQDASARSHVRLSVEAWADLQARLKVLRNQ